MTSRLKKASYTAIIGLGLFAGAAGIAAASSGGGSPTPTPPISSTPPTLYVPPPQWTRTCSRRGS